jgi:hypothetical protein
MAGTALAIEGCAPNGSEPEAIMWNLFNCYLSGRHDYGMWCEPGTIFLRCLQCGKRSAGWTMNAKAPVPLARPMLSLVTATTPVTRPRVLPFARAATAP